MWTSWPQACMRPFVAAKGEPVSSRMGRASSSARTTTACSRLSDPRQEARAGDALYAPGPEGFRDEAGGSVLLVARLRPSVQPLAQYGGSAEAPLPANGGAC